MKSIQSQKIKFLKILLFFGVFCGSAFLVFHLFFYVDRQEEKKLVKKAQKVERLSPQQTQKLQNGDIILRRGYGFFSNMISEKLNENSPYDVTHSGIVYQKKGHWWVIHSLSSDATPIDGMQEQPLSDFLKYSMPQKILVVRVKNTSKEQRQKIVERALYYLQKKVPFDRLGVIDEPSELYCTELVWQILDTDLHLIALPTSPKERQKIFYSMVGTYNPKWFEVVINTYPKPQVYKKTPR